MENMQKLVEDLNIMIRAFQKNEDTSGLYLIEHGDVNSLEQTRDIIVKYQKSFLDEIAILKKRREAQAQNMKHEPDEDLVKKIVSTVEHEFVRYGNKHKYADAKAEIRSLLQSHAKPRVTREEIEGIFIEWQHIGFLSLIELTKVSSALIRWLKSKGLM